MEKKYSAEIPQQIINTAPKGILNHGVYEVSEEEMKQLWDEQRGSMKDMPEEPDEWFRTEHKYGYYATEVPMGQWSRDGIVNAIIRDKYRIDEMEAITNNTPFKIGGNVLNRGVIPNLPALACGEVPCLVDANGVTPTYDPQAEYWEDWCQYRRDCVTKLVKNIRAMIDRDAPQVLQMVSQALSYL